MKIGFLPKPGGRAVTPAFRVFGGVDEEMPADATLPTDAGAMHRGERWALGLLFPWVAGVAVFDGLWRCGGPWLAWLGVVPGALLVLHVMAFALGVSRPQRAWWLWSIFPTIWSVWALGEQAPVVRATAGMWWALLGLQGLGCAALLWRRGMQVAGWSGVWLRIGIFLVTHAGVAWLWVQTGWQAGLAAGMLCGLAWCWVTFRPCNGGFGEVLCRSTGGRVLTIDDGPHPEDTPRVLDILDQFGCKAVFFVVGERVRRYPELAREIVRRGHELGNHTMTHPQAWMWCLGPWRTRREIADCQRVIEEVTGQRPRWFRAPVGHRNAFTHPFAAAMGLKVVAWSRRGFDTVERDLGKMVKAFCDDPRGDDVLLLHEGTPVAVELLTRVLEAGRAAEGSDHPAPGEGK